MKLVFVISSLEAGGAERVLSQVATYWAEEKGHEVHIIIFRPKGSTPFYPLSSKVTLHALGDLKRLNMSLVSWAKRFVSSLWRLRFLLRDLKPDYIISFVNVINIVTLGMTLGLKIPVMISERTDPKRYRIGILGDLARRLLYPLAYRLVLQGNYVRASFPYLSKTISVIPNPVPFPKKRADSVESSFVIMIVGRLDLYKGHYELIHAFAKLEKAFPKWFVEIYGEGPERENLEALIAKYHLRNKVFLKGLASPIQTELRRAALFAFPTHYEGFSNALAEAMAVGLPVVVSDCDGNLELVDHEKNGFVFPVGDVDKLASSLFLCLSDSKKRGQFGAAARQSIKKFSPEKVFQKWDEIIETR